MDPLSQAVSGAALAGLAASKEKIRPALLLGALAGMAPDLDVLIRSDTDPLLSLEYHRHFTHALLFIPVGALICAAFFYLFPLIRRQLSFKDCYVFSFLGYATHGLLDACTSYGTYLYWPLSDARVSWDIISIIDVFYTLPILALLIYAAIKRAPRAAAIALIWGLAYLGLGLFQHHRAMAEAKQWVAAHAENPTRLTARPTFSNLWVWRIVFLDGNEWRTVALYKPFWPGAVTRIYNGDRVEAQPELFFLGYEPEHQPAIDIMRFNHFSDGYLGFYRRDDGLYYGDVRYGTYPNSATPLWGIRIPENCPDCHVEFVRFERQMEWSKYWAFLKGATLPEGVEGGRLTRVP